MLFRVFSVCQRRPFIAIHCFVNIRCILPTFLSFTSRHWSFCPSSMFCMNMCILICFSLTAGIFMLKCNWNILLMRCCKLVHHSRLHRQHSTCFLCFYCPYRFQKLPTVFCVQCLLSCTCFIQTCIWCICEPVQHGWLHLGLWVWKFPAENLFHLSGDLLNNYFHFIIFNYNHTKKK